MIMDPSRIPVLGGDVIGTKMDSNVNVTSAERLGKIDCRTKEKRRIERFKKKDLEWGEIETRVSELGPDHMTTEKNSPRIQKSRTQNRDRQRHGGAVWGSVQGGLGRGGGGGG